MMYYPLSFSKYLAMDIKEYHYKQLLRCHWKILWLTKLFKVSNDFRLRIQYIYLHQLLHFPIYLLSLILIHPTQKLPLLDQPVCFTIINLALLTFLYITYFYLCNIRGQFISRNLEIKYEFFWNSYFLIRNQYSNQTFKYWQFQSKCFYFRQCI